eukprot:139466-Pelagomonas_calceolata.AAC.2
MLTWACRFAILASCYLHGTASKQQAIASQQTNHQQSPASKSIASNCQQANQSPASKQSPAISTIRWAKRSALTGKQSG